MAGDSAGGGMALALCHLLKDLNKPLPRAIITMSPWTDLTLSGASYIDNFKIDPLFGNSTDSLVFNKDYVGNMDPANKFISPLFGDFAGFPPMLMQVGTHEMLLSDTLEVEKKAKEAGVEVALSVYEGMFHVFQMAKFLIPESKNAWKEVARFLHKL